MNEFWIKQPSHESTTSSYSQAKGLLPTAIPETRGFLDRCGDTEEHSGDPVDDRRSGVAVGVAKVARGSGTRRLRFDSHDVVQEFDVTQSSSEAVSHQTDAGNDIPHIREKYIEEISNIVFETLRLQMKGLQEAIPAWPPVQDKNEAEGIAFIREMLLERHVNAASIDCIGGLTEVEMAAFRDSANSCIDQGIDEWRDKLGMG